jgi:hypothetical protein
MVKKSGTPKAAKRASPPVNNVNNNSSSSSSSSSSPPNNSPSSSRQNMNSRKSKNNSNNNNNNNHNNKIHDGTNDVTEVSTNGNSNSTTSSRNNNQTTTHTTTTTQQITDNEDQAHYIGSRNPVKQFGYESPRRTMRISIDENEQNLIINHVLTHYEDITIQSINQSISALRTNERPAGAVFQYEEAPDHDAYHATETNGHCYFLAQSQLYIEHVHRMNNIASEAQYLNNLLGRDDMIQWFDRLRKHNVMKRSLQLRDSEQQNDYEIWLQIMYEWANTNQTKQISKLSLITSGQHIQKRSTYYPTCSGEATTSLKASTSPMNSYNYAPIMTMSTQRLCGQISQASVVVHCTH